MAVLEGLEVGHACRECGRRFATPRALGAHRGQAHRPPPLLPVPPAPVPGWRIEAGPPGWQWALAWRWRPGGGYLDGVPDRLRYDVVRRCWLAGTALTDPDAVLAVAVHLLASRGIVVAGIEELPAPAVPGPPPPPRWWVRRRASLTFADLFPASAAHPGLVGVGRGGTETITRTDFPRSVD